MLIDVAGRIMFHSCVLMMLSRLPCVLGVNVVSSVRRAGCQRQICQFWSSLVNAQVELEDVCRAPALLLFLSSPQQTFLRLCHLFILGNVFILDCFKYVYTIYVQSKKQWTKYWALMNRLPLPTIITAV